MSLGGLFLHSNYLRKDTMMAKASMPIAELVEKGPKVSDCRVAGHRSSYSR